MIFFVSQNCSKVRFSYQCSDHLSHSKNFTSLFPLTFLSKHISLYALGRLKWILDIIWPLNQHFKLKNQRNWLKQVRMWKFWNVMNCILLHWYKHLTLEFLWNPHFSVLAIRSLVCRKNFIRLHQSKVVSLAKKREH